MSSLGEELPKEMARVRDDILPAYVQLGTSGAIAASMMCSDLDQATKAMAEGDTVAMVRAYPSLKEYRL